MEVGLGVEKRNKSGFWVEGVFELLWFLSFLCLFCLFDFDAKWKFSLSAMFALKGGSLVT